MDYEKELVYTGHRDQLFRIQRIRLEEGRAAGVSMIDVSNRSGLHFDVNVSRGMDIPYLDFKGENIGYLSPCGIVGPEYFDDKGLGFLKSFTAGFMTTCGLKLAGAACEYDGKSYGLHGNISHTPAEGCSFEITGEPDGPCAVIRGCMRDAIIFGERLTLYRTIFCRYKEKSLTIRDRVVNEGYQRVRHMILYHCNIGYPLLSPASEIYIPALKTVPRDEYAKGGLDTWMNATPADPAYQEMCFYHQLKHDDRNHAVAAVYQPELEMGIAIDIDLRTLDHFVQWKMMGAGDYVMGLEPGNSTIDGIGDAVENGSMKYLDPGESVEYELKFQILEGRGEFEAVK